MLALKDAVEAIEISEEGEAIAAMIDFPAGETIDIEQQEDAGDDGIYGWEHETITAYRSRGWNADTVTIFRARGRRYLTLNLPKQSSEPLTQ